jgi:two-component system CheB/CheR fusion protein
VGNGFARRQIRVDLSTAAASSGPFSVVGIGASAGGLESLELLFAALPADPGLAFVVVQHLSPDFRSLMDELLARHTSMAIHLARHERVLLEQCGHVVLEAADGASALAAIERSIRTSR